MSATPPPSAAVAIGTAARRAGVSARMVRHYEALGLLAPVARSDSGYRQYSDTDIHTLRFIRRARELGFSMEEIATLLVLWQEKDRDSSPCILHLGYRQKKERYRPRTYLRR